MYYCRPTLNFYHTSIIKFANRPFSSLEEMHEAFIDNHNAIVRGKDITVHGGDFSFATKAKTFALIARLNGTHIFLKGCHDRWMGKSGVFQKGKIQGVGYLYTKRFDKIHIVVSHWAMRTWPRSHFNSFQLFAHSHGRLEGTGKQIDIGVDTEYPGIHEKYYPYSLDEIIEIMEERPDNFNLVERVREIDQFSIS